jgi:hypothetical protein
MDHLSEQYRGSIHVDAGGYTHSDVTSWSVSPWADCFVSARRGRYTRADGLHRFRERGACGYQHATLNLLVALRAWLELSATTPSRSEFRSTEISALRARRVRFFAGVRLLRFPVSRPVASRFVSRGFIGAGGDVGLPFAIFFSHFELAVIVDRSTRGIGHASPFLPPTAERRGPAKTFASLTPLQ